MEEEREDRPWQGFYCRAEDETRGLELEDREASGDHRLLSWLAWPVGF